MSGEPPEAEMAAPAQTMECEKDVVSLFYSIFFFSELLTGLLGTKWK